MSDKKKTTHVVPNKKKVAGMLKKVGRNNPFLTTGKNPPEG